jgi:Flp pilus assembly pilin Flp
VLSLLRRQMENAESFPPIVAREEGQGLSEYGLLLVWVALAAITSMSTLANAVTTVFSTAVSTRLPKAALGCPPSVTPPRLLSPPSE